VCEKRNGGLVPTFHYTRPAFHLSLTQHCRLRPNQHQSTQLSFIDGGGIPEDFMSDLASDPALRDIVDVVGMHYPCNKPNAAIVNDYQKKYWASEDWWSQVWRAIKQAKELLLMWYFRDIYLLRWYC